MEEPYQLHRQVKLTFCCCECLAPAHSDQTEQKANNLYMRKQRRRSAVQ